MTGTLRGHEHLSPRLGRRLRPLLTSPQPPLAASRLPLPSSTGSPAVCTGPSRSFTRRRSPGGTPPPSIPSGSLAVHTRGPARRSWPSVSCRCRLQELWRTSICSVTPPSAPPVSRLGCFDPLGAPPGCGSSGCRTYPQCMPPTRCLLDCICVPCSSPVPWPRRPHPCGCSPAARCRWTRCGGR